MEPLTRNGGFIGATLDFASQEQYIIGTVAGSVTHFATTTGSSRDVTYPTGIQADDIIILAVAADSRDPNSYSDVNGVQFDRIYNDGTSANGSVHALRVTASTGTYADNNTLDAMNWVCSVFRGVDPTQTLSSMFVNARELANLLPDPPSTGSAVPTDAMIVITGALDDDDEANWTPAAPSGFTLAGYNGGTGNNATAMMAYAQGTGVIVDPSPFTAATGSATDENEATTLVLNGGGLVTQYGNYKNSGIWDLQAVYDSLYVPTSFASASWSTVGSQALDQTTYTFGLNLLNPTPGKCLLVVHSFDNDGSVAPTSVTVGGAALTHLGGETSGSARVRVDMYQGTYSNATTSAVITYAIPQENVGLGAYVLFNAPDAPYSTSGASANNTTIATTEGGLVIAAGLSVNGTLSTWTGVSEDYEIDIRSSEWATAGHIEGTTAQSDYSVSATGIDCIFAASW